MKEKNIKEKTQQKKKMGLTTKIFVALIAGAILGIVLCYLVPDSSFKKDVIVEGILYVIGQGFIRLMQMLVVPLVFCSLICGSMAIGDTKTLGKVGVKTIGFYLVTTALAVCVALGSALLINPGRGLIQRILQLVGLGKGSLLYTEEAVLLGMVYNFLPFMILQIQTSLSKMDNSLLEASADLGASPAQTFKRVTLPLSVPGIINGITLVFLPAVSSFFIPKLLGGGQYFLIGNMIENQFITVGEWNFGSAISMIMAVIMMVLMMVVRKIEIRNQGGKGV